MFEDMAAPPFLLLPVLLPCFAYFDKSSMERRTECNGRIENNRVPILIVSPDISTGVPMDVRNATVLNPMHFLESHTNLMACIVHVSLTK